MPKPAQPQKKRLLLWICVDVALLGALLVCFAYFHHVRVKDYAPVALAAPAPAATPAPEAPEETPAPDPTPTPEVEESAEPTEAPTPTPNVSGLLKGKYAEKFTHGEIEHTDTTYRSANVCIEVETVQTEDPWLTYYLADIYIQDISSFKTAVALEYEEQNPAKIKSTMDAKLFSSLVGSIVSISGDNFFPQPTGRWVVRNGVEWKRSRPLSQDICVLYADGVMESYKSKEVDFDAILARDPLHIWAFGPELLVDGQVATITGGAGGSATKANPRAAVGYYEPGHYCFLLADGRQRNYSLGMTCTEMSELFFLLGCKVAYNLDGGDTAVMCWGEEWISRPQDEAPRPGSDLLYIVEPDGTEAAQ